MADPALLEPTRAEAPPARRSEDLVGVPAVPLICLAVAVASSAAVLLIYQHDLTFRDDEWFFLLERRGFNAGAFLDPNNDHIALAIALIYKPLLALFGMTSAFPFTVVATGVFLLSAVLLFLYVRRRLGVWPAVLASILILFLGAAWTDLLWAFQIGFTGSVAAGIGALLALDRDDRRGDLAACALLVLSASFSEIGVPFVVGAFVSVVLGPQPRLKRLYVPFVPLALYGLWYLGWGHTGAHWESTHNLVNSPRFIFDAVSANLASLFGIARPMSSDASRVGGLTWGHILLVIAIALAIWRLWRGARPSRWLWAVLAAGLAFWFLTAWNAFPVARTPTTGRYQYPGAIFLLLIAAEALRGIRFWLVDKRVLVPAAAVTVAAAISGVDLLHYGYVQYSYQTNDERARLAAVEIARGTEPVDYPIHFRWWLAIDARKYFSAVNAFGSPAFSESQLATAWAPHRTAADQELARAEGIALGPIPPGASRAAERGGDCRALNAPESSPALSLSPGHYVLTAKGAPAPSISLARFADTPSVSLGVLEPGTASALDIPPDRSGRPWRLYSGSLSVATVCKLARHQRA